VTLYAVDPGTSQSALVELADGRVSGEIFPNSALLAFIRTHPFPADAHLVIEQVESFGMPVGREVFDTVFWSGRFVEAWDRRNAGAWSALPRRAVKLALCNSARAKDPHIRQALIDRYGGETCTRKGGALASVKSHLWAALAVGVTYLETQQQEGSRHGEARSEVAR
jgi:hypothetical protein